LADLAEQVSSSEPAPEEAPTHPELAVPAESSPLEEAPSQTVGEKEEEKKKEEPERGKEGIPSHG
jgi:hypothetical protein